MKLLCFPKYTEKGPSSRYRFYQYLPYFNDYNIELYPFFNDSYYSGMAFKSLKGIFYVLKCYGKRIINLSKIKKGNIVLLQYEFLQYMPFNTIFFKVFDIDYIVDFDDAVFHDYDRHKNRLIRYVFKNKIAKVIKHAKIVITGSPYLTGYALMFNKNVIEIPTSIDFEKYSKIEVNTPKTQFVIGWIGSKTTSKNVLRLIPTFKKMQKEDLSFKIHLIGFDNTLQSKLNGLPVKFIPWNATAEVQEISKFSVGIMPLEDNLFNKGKCGFKLIQYMACGIPTIASNFEANIKIDRNNENLFVDECNDWYTPIMEMFNNQSKYSSIGTRNKLVVSEYYCIQSNYKTYLGLFSKFLN